MMMFWARKPLANAISPKIDRRYGRLVERNGESRELEKDYSVRRQGLANQEPLSKIQFSNLF